MSQIVCYVHSLNAVWHSDFNKRIIYSLSQPCLLLSTAPSTHYRSLAKSYCYCYSCPFFCYHQTLLVLLSLRWPPGSRLSCLDRVINSAVRLIPAYQKFYYISSCMRATLNWLLLRQRIEYRIVALV